MLRRNRRDNKDYLISAQLTRAQIFKQNEHLSLKSDPDKTESSSNLAGTVNQRQSNTPTRVVIPSSITLSAINKQVKESGTSF